MKKLLLTIPCLVAVSSLYAGICETCMKSCTIHKAGLSYTVPSGPNTYIYHVSSVSGARQCGGWGVYCSGDSTEVVCESGTRDLYNANGVYSGNFPYTIYVNPCH